MSDQYDKESYFRTYGWNWGVVKPPKKPKQKVFRYGCVELLRPTISIHGENENEEMGQGTMPHIRKAFN